MSESQEIRGLSIYPGCEIITENYLLNENRYTKALNLPERGTNESKSVSFDVSKNADIYITAQASNEIRELLLVNEFGSVIDSATLTTTPKTYHMNYTGNGDKLFIRSKSAGIRIFDISIKTENNMQPLNKTWKFNDCVPNDVLDDDITGLRLTGAVTLMTEPTANSDKLYVQSLNLAETGTTANNNIKLNVPTDTTLKITVSSSDDVNRQMLITNQYGYVLGNVTTTDVPTEISITSTCDNETVCIRSLNGSIYVQEIAVGTGSGIEDGIIEHRADIDSAVTSTETINNLMLDNYNSNYKSQLSATEKSIYELFVQKFVSDNPATDEFVKIVYENAVVEYTDTNTENLRKSVRNAFSAFINDYPEVFWIDTLALTFVSNGRNIYETYIWVLRDDSFADNPAVTNAISQLNTALNTFETFYNNGTFRFEARSADDYDKVKFIYLYIMDNVNFTSASTAKNRHNVYGALVLQSAECDGIARAFKLLCKKCNIPAVYACGKINNLTHNAYAWNYVNVFGDWYMCDITTDIVNETAHPEYSMTAANGNYTKGNPSIYKEYNGITYAYPAIQSYDCFIWGDANLSGVLDSADSDYTLCMVLNASYTTEKRSFINADVSGDGTITSNDSTMILQKYINPDWNIGDPIDSSIRDMFGIDGVAIYNENMSALDMNNDSIVNVDDWVIGVNNILAENSGSSTYSTRRTVTKKTVTRQMILDLFK